MENKQTVQPDFDGELGVALWKKTDKNGNSYYTLKINNVCNLFAVRKKVVIEGGDKNE